MLPTLLLLQLVAHLLGLLWGLGWLLNSLSLDFLDVEDFATLLDCLTFFSLAHEGWVF